jgi:hypothetical protein
MTISPPSFDRGRTLAAMIAGGSHCEQRVKDQAEQLLKRTDLDEDGMLVELDQLYQRAQPHGQDDLFWSATDLGRALGIDTFLRWHTRREVHDRFLGMAALYRSLVVHSPARVINDLPDTGIIIEAKRSWMAPLDGFRKVKVEDLAAILKTPHLVDPPAIVLCLPADRLRNAGVRVRRPCPLDAIPERHTQWEDSAVDGEVIDGDIPRSACDRAEVIQ